MANENIKFGELVPADIRLQVYREAISLIEANKIVYGLTGSGGRPSFQLCLLLPCILYNADYLTVFSPRGNSWVFTPDMFPEIEKWANNDSHGLPFHCNSPEMQKLRLDVLENAINSIRDGK